MPDDPVEGNGSPSTPANPGPDEPDISTSATGRAAREGDAAISVEGRTASRVETFHGKTASTAQTFHGIEASDQGGTPLPLRDQGGEQSTEGTVAAEGSSTETPETSAGGYGQGAYGSGPYGGGTVLDNDEALIAHVKRTVRALERGIGEYEPPVGRADSDDDRAAERERASASGVVFSAGTSPTSAQEAVSGEVFSTGAPGAIWAPTLEVIEPVPPQIPPTRSAAIEPEWIDGRLTLRSEPARADLPADQIAAMLLVLRRDVEGFADDIASTNADHRFIGYLRRMTALIPDAAPDQVAVFQLGHAADLLEAYADSFTDETAAAFQVEQYKGLVRRFQQAVAQFTAWRDFKRNALAQELTNQQIEIAPRLAWALAAGMETDEARTFVDPALPKALTELAAAGDHPTEVMTAGQDLRAADIVSSSNNIFSSLGEMVLAKSKPAKDAFDRGVIKGFEKVGENVVVYAANLLGYGAAATIMALFPEFAWVVALAVFAKAVASAMGK